MFTRLRAFFSRLLGGSPPESAALSTDHIEDAADLQNQGNVIHVEGPEARSRGLEDNLRLDSSREEAEGSGDLSAAAPRPITITTPRYLWCLDNGHGRLQPGKRSPLFPDGTRFEEWEFTRDIVRRIKPQLDQIGIQYFEVVPEDEVGSFLAERVSRANEKESPLGLPKIFLSVHANAAGGMDSWVNGASGIEVWHYPGNETGLRMSSAFQSALMAALPDWKDRGVRSHQVGSSKIFYVLRNTSMPAVLTENGFYTDEEEAAALRTDAVRQKIADAHVAAILRIEQEGPEAIPIYRPNMVIA
ncbi:MAG: N-acetylmuramoyl-L-alanine amidase [Bacteroidetes bacterium]|nr:MAG: N-acetylmuramoyl-L-alanine amidase [Bacteroidota bacterium]